jgi:DNA-binding NarL/FixJ family response regulator
MGSVVCPTIIGRGALLAQLDEALDSARQGDARPILIAGEAGMGKSRIVAQVQEYAREQGFQIFRGSCFQPDSACPFAPLLDLARAHFTSAADLGPLARDLYPLLPDLVPRPDDAALSPPIAPEHQRRHLLSVLAQLFLHHAARKPLLLVIEDLHWSDDDSLAWLHLLMRRATGHPLLIVATVRSEDVGTGLRHWLDLLNRERLIDELTLPALSMTDVADMLAAIFTLSQPVRREFLEPMYEFSQGNPFVVEELLKTLVEAGEIVHTEDGWFRNPIERLRPHIPRSLHHAVQQRCSGLKEDARQLLHVAAVAGRRIDIAILQEITSLDESVLLELLKELVDAQLLIEESADHFVFRHALTQQAVTEELLSRERRAIHRRYAETIERMHAASLDRFAADLSEHFYEAEVWDMALDYSLRAGRQAQTLYSPRAAIVHWTRAIEASGHLGQETSAALYRARGQAHEMLGNFEATLADYQSALRRAQATGDRMETWQLLLDIGFLWTGRDYLRADDYFSRALALARDLGEPATIGHSLNRVANWHANQEQSLLAIQHHQDALAIFEKIDDQQGIASTLDLLGMATALNGDLGKALAYGQRALALFEELDDRHGVISCLTTLAMAPGIVYEASAVAGPGTLSGPMSELERALMLTRDIDWRSGEAFALGIVGELLAGRGEFGRGLDELNHALALAEEIGHLQWMIQALYGLGCLHHDLYQYGAAEGFLRRALTLAQSIHSAVWVNMVSGALASLLIAQDDLTSAEALLGESLPPATPMQTMGQRLMWCARSELALARQEPESALVLLNGLYATAANLTHEGEIPRLARLKGKALGLLGQSEDAQSLIERAISFAEARDGLPMLYQLHAALASLASSTDQLATAERHRALALTLIDRLASSLPLEHLAESFRAGATEVVSAGLSSRRKDRRAIGGLTAREWEVTTLILQGRTNREIGDALFVSTRTIETHVANILHKLGFTSRAQIAGWASKLAAREAT